MFNRPTINPLMERNQREVERKRMKELRLQKIESDYQRLEKRVEGIEKFFGVMVETLDSDKVENEITERNNGIQNGVKEKDSISIQGIIGSLQTFKVKIDETVNEINNYLESLKDEEFMMVQGLPN